MSEEIKPCPCGQTPTKLCLMDTGQGMKWGIASGNCCNEWNVEFRTGYNPIDSKECYDIAVGYWNDAPRSNNWISVEERSPEDHSKQYVIKHYNGFMEIARFDGVDWHSISPRFGMMDEKLSKEGQPDFWMLPGLPKNQTEDIQ